MATLNSSIVSKRLLETLRSPGMAGSDATIHVLLKFEDEAALQAFVANPNDGASKLGVDVSTFKLGRVLPELGLVSGTIEARAVSDLSVMATDAGVSLIDENSVVVALAQLATDSRQPAPSRAAAVSDAQLYGLTGKGVRVAVLDTGVDAAHPDFSGRVEAYNDFTGDGRGDRVGHGTHCAGLVGGSGLRNASYRALAWESVLIDVKVLNDQGRGRTDAIAAGIVWAVNQAKADILSLSLGTSGDFDGNDPLSQSVAWATERGVHVFVAAGNCGPSGNELSCTIRGPRSITSPGVAASAITVGATGKDGAIAPFSSRGPTLGGLVKPDVVIRGEDVASALAQQATFGTAIDSFYTRASGTSMATPQCAAIGALVVEAARKSSVNVSPTEMKELFAAGSKLIPDVPPSWQGAGITEAAAVLRSFYARHGAPQNGGEALDVVLEPVGALSVERGQRALFRVTALNRDSALMPAVAVRVSSNDAQLELAGPDALKVAELGPGDSRSATFYVTALSASSALFSVSAVFTKSDGSEHTEELDVNVRVTEDAPVDLSQSRLDDVLTRSVELLMASQRPNGTWAGDIMFNGWTNGMYCILYKILGLPGEPTASLAWLESHRNGLNEQGAPDGTFGIVDPPSQHMVEATVAAQVALEIWGRPRDQRAWDFINGMSEARLADVISNADPFTQCFVSLAARFRPPGTTEYYSLGDVLIPPIELLAIPSFIPASVTGLFAAWGQDAIAALAIIGVVCKEPYPTVAHRVLLAKAERQLLRNQNADGGWYGTILPTFAGTLAMHLLGYPNSHPVMQNALRFMNNQLRADGYLTRYELPVWDTSLAILALREAGVPANDPHLIRGANYLISSQTPNGGIPFKLENVPYPDTDDTCFAALALSLVDHPQPELKRQTIERALKWLFYMQGNTGGWAAFSKDQSVKTPDRAPVFKDDPPTADVTGHVLSSLKLAHGACMLQRAQDAKQRGFDWLRSQQLPKGGWYGRWGMTVTYATSAVLQAIEDLGENPDQPLVTAAVRGLLAMQRADGGWGEGFRTYYDVNARENAPSTVEQTAWSVVGLLCVPQTPETRVAIERGVAFLLAKFDPASGFGEATYSVGALWIYRNGLYPLFWSIWALAKYRNKVSS